MARKALARKISYKRARSYRRTVPNPSGVTAIASVNRSSSYARRYAAARNILTGTARARSNRAAKSGDRDLKRLAKDMRKAGHDEERVAYALSAAARARGMSAAEVRKQGFDPAKLPGFGKGPAAPARKKTAKAAKKETKVAKKTRKKTAKRTAKKKVAKRTTKRKVAKKKVARKKTTKRKVAKKKVAKRTTKRKVAKKKVARKKTTKRKVAKRTTKRKVTKKVAKKKVTRRKKKLTPEQRLAKRKAELEKKKKACVREERKALRTYRRKQVSVKRATKARKDVAKYKRRASKAKSKLGKRQAKPRIYAGRFWAPTVRVSPANALDAYVYETRAGTLKKVPFYALAGYRTRAQMKKVIDGGSEFEKEQDRITKLYDRTMKRRGKAAEKMRKHGGIFVPNRRRGAKTRALTFEEWESMKSNKRRRRRGRKARRNLTVRQRAALAKGRSMASRRAKTARRNPVSQAAANKRRKVTRRKKATRRPRTVYRSYRRNAALAGSYQKQLMQALKLGSVITAGYLVHRVLSNVVKQNVFRDNQYGELISGAIVAAVGVPLSVKVAPGDSKLVSAGMMVSLVQSGLMAILAAVDKDGTATAYLSGYGDRRGSAFSGMGSYYEFQPHQQMGEYYQTSGLGQLQQAAAGVGQLQQAAAGMGQLVQAAAGAGEYLAVGAEGIGEYEEVTPEYTRPIPIDEGISPDLSTAEQALSMAEAAAGVGGMGAQYQGVPAVSMVNPTGFETGVKDGPAGTRAGTLAGKEGIFGNTG